MGYPGVPAAGSSYTERIRAVLFSFRRSGNPLGLFSPYRGTYSQHAYSAPVPWSTALPGDLVFYPGDSHVGIVGGRDENGDLLIIHCASGANNVVITGAGGFTSLARPTYFLY